MKKLLALVAVMLLAACGGDATAETTVPADVEGDFEVITVSDIAYPAESVIPEGKGVRFDNESGLSHTVTFEEKDGESFTDRYELSADGSVAFDLDPGEYVYFCEFHPSMRGTLVVEG